MKNTIDNLAKAFVGESQARNRYTFYARIAQKEGFEQIAEIFIITADNEKEHAKWLLRLINQLIKKGKGKQRKIEVKAGIPTTLAKTVENLRAAIQGENHEYTQMYPEFAKVAQKEGYSGISKRLKAFAMAEKHHEERFKKLLKEVEGKTLLSKKKKTSWICRKCGYEHQGKRPPVDCPSCSHPKEYFQIKAEIY